MIKTSRVLLLGNLQHYIIKRHLTSKKLIMDSKSGTNFSFMNYNVIGFDLDHCLCRYNLPELFKLEYDIISDFFIKHTQHPTTYLKLPFEQHKHLILKGLFMDLTRGNILKISSDGRIQSASHGTRKLSTNEIANIYKNSHWDLTDRYIKDPLSLWLSEDSMKIQALMDYFDLPVALIFARLVDGIDADTCAKNYDVFPDMLKALHDMYDVENFPLNKGGFYTALKNETSKYILPSGESVIQWIKSLKQNGKFVFLLSGSNFDYGSLIANQAFGNNWESLFDLMIYRSRKPGFWHLNRPFIQNQIEILPEQLIIGEKYTGGNFNQLHTFLENHLQIKKPKVLYIGDSLIQDIYAPNFFCDIDTVAIVEELQAEDSVNSSTDNEQLATKNSFWGSFFINDQSDGSETFWNSLIQKHAKFIAPSITALAEKPIGYRYQQFGY